MRKNHRLAIALIAALVALAIALATWQSQRASQPVASAVLLDGERVCMVAPEPGAWAGEGEPAVAYKRFRIAEALEYFNQRNGSSANSLDAISLDVLPAATDRHLQLELGGESLAFGAAAGQPLAAVFPGQLLRSHSDLLVSVTDSDSGEPVDLADYRGWKLCGRPHSDAGFQWRDPVANDVSPLQLKPGVNVMGGEYACVQGWGLHHHTAAGVTHRELADMLSAWRVGSLRLPLNEHCWLADTHGFDQLNPEFTGQRYRDSVRELVDLLTLAPYNMRVIIDLHWTGSRAEQALELKPLPDREFAQAFWRSAAQAFADNESVLFNLFNEPHVPRDAPRGAGARLASDQSGANQIARELAGDAIAAARSRNWWAIWRDGNRQYAGMQALVDAVRETGAGNHIVIGGLDYAGDLRGWASYAPHDPLGKLWADNHAYPAGEKCRRRHCWQRTLLPLQGLGYGVMFGETGNSIGEYPQGCEAHFVKRVYRFAREYRIAALGWTFLPGGTQDPASNEPRQNSCQIPSLITRWPGEGRDDGDLSPGEIADKRTFDPTPAEWADDATWAGCAALAYLYDLSLADDFLPDVDPQLHGHGNCAAALGLSIPGG